MAPWTALGSVRGYPPVPRGWTPRALCWHACQPPVRASPGVSLRPALARLVSGCSSAPHPRASRPRAPSGTIVAPQSDVLAWRLAPSPASGTTTRFPKACAAVCTRVPHRLLAGDLTLCGVARCEGLPRRPGRSVAVCCLWRLATPPGSSRLPSAHACGSYPRTSSRPRWLYPPTAECLPVAPGHALGPCGPCRTTTMCGAARLWLARSRDGCARQSLSDPPVAPGHSLWLC